MRHTTQPKRHDDFIDFSYPTQYLEETFIEFENYVLRTHNPNYNSPDQPHANSEYIMFEFDKYERFLRNEALQIYRENRARKTAVAANSNTHKVGKFHFFYS